MDCVACLSTDRPNDRLCPLHASAGDLLAALEAILTQFGPEHMDKVSGTMCGSIARAAIRKARGEAHEPSRAKGE